MIIFKAVLTLIIGGVDDVSLCTLLDCIEYISLQAHIAAIFLSKITSYHDFHTQLYTCSAEFDTLPLDYPIQLSATLLLPAAVFVMVTVSFRLIQHVYLGQSYDIPLAEKAYFLLQSLAFALLAVLIMRLKLFLTPQLCLLTAILAKVKVSLSIVLLTVQVHDNSSVSVTIHPTSINGCASVWCLLQRTLQFVASICT